MKKVTFILLIIALTSVLTMSSGCYIQKNAEFNKTKQEIVKFDEEYWALTLEKQKNDDEYSKKIDSLPANEIINSTDDRETTIAKINTNIDRDKQLIEMQKDSLKFYLNYVSRFRKLTVPGKLDVFYNEKIKQFEKATESSEKFISGLSDDLIYWENFGEAFKSDFTDTAAGDSAVKKADERDALLKESGALLKEANDLSVSCEKIKLDVYREFGLDDLIAKWQN